VKTLVLKVVYKHNSIWSDREIADFIRFTLKKDYPVTVTVLKRQKPQQQKGQKDE